MIDSSTLKFDNNNLIPAIIQDADSLRVLMLGYMNKEAVDQTQKTKLVTFYSRSRQEIWVKGETSGNYLEFISMRYDCDADALLRSAKPQGPTCHTGKESCFHNPDLAADGKLQFLTQLQNLLIDRKNTMPEGSYTSMLFGKGLDKVAQKVGEEAVETVIAAKNDDIDEFIYEASDLLFHLMMLLTEKGLQLEDLVNELQKRHSK